MSKQQYKLILFTFSGNEIFTKIVQVFTGEMKCSHAPNTTSPIPFVLWNLFPFANCRAYHARASSHLESAERSFPRIPLWYATSIGFNKVSNVLHPADFTPFVVTRRICSPEGESNCLYGHRVIFSLLLLNTFSLSIKKYSWKRYRCSW